MGHDHSTPDIENGKWPPTLHRLYTLSVIYGQDYDRLASLCGVPASEALKEHKKLGLPHTYLIGPVPEAHKSTALSAVALREKLRAERTNLVPRVIATWQEVPLVLQLMNGSDPLYGYVGMDDYTLHPIVRPGAFVRIDPRQKKIPYVHWHSDYDRLFRAQRTSLALAEGMSRCVSTSWSHLVLRVLYPVLWWCFDSPDIP